MQTIDSLIQLLKLEQISENTFVGQNYQAPWGRVFGGQVLGQSLSAAYQTVPKDRFCHSLHAYFILGGELDIPINYEVNMVRDGGSFTTRTVVAWQKDKAIFSMTASFQILEDGVEHQLTIPNIIPPEKLTSASEQIEAIKELFPSVYNRVKLTLPELFEFRPIDNVLSIFSKNGSPYNNVWMKSTQEVPTNDLALQQQILAYLSDYNILMTATFPNREILNQSKTLYASIDHSIWFHRSFHLKDWLLYAMDSPSASNGRGFARGSIFSKEGYLIASVAQEGLMRQSK